jgi:hypothetical protein
MYASIQTPAGADVTASYGKVGQVPGAMFKTFMSMFEGESASKPHHIAEAAMKLVGQPRAAARRARWFCIRCRQDQ